MARAEVSFDLDISTKIFATTKQDTYHTLRVN